MRTLRLHLAKNLNIFFYKICFFNFSNPIEGSVDEESAKSDEEYDEQENGYIDEEYNNNLSDFLNNNNNNKGDKFPPTLNMFLRAQGEPLTEQNGSKSSLLEETDEKTMSYISNYKAKICSFNTSSTIQ